MLAAGDDDFAAPKPSPLYCSIAGLYCTVLVAILAACSMARHCTLARACYSVFQCHMQHLYGRDKPEELQVQNCVLPSQEENAPPQKQQTTPQ